MQRGGVHHHQLHFARLIQLQWCSCFAHCHTHYVRQIRCGIRACNSSRKDDEIEVVRKVYTFEPILRIHVSGLDIKYIFVGVWTYGVVYPILHLKSYS